MPCIWFAAVPLAAASAIAALYLMTNFRSSVGVAAAFVVSVVVLLGGLARGQEINRMLQDLDEPEPRRNRR